MVHLKISAGFQAKIELICRVTEAVVHIDDSTSLKNMNGTTRFARPIHLSPVIRLLLVNLIAR